MGLYPLRMGYEKNGSDEVAVVIEASGWSFATTTDRQRFDALPVGDRLALRSEFEAQVRLAQNTPTKGDI